MTITRTVVLLLTAASQPAPTPRPAGPVPATSAVTPAADAQASGSFLSKLEGEWAGSGLVLKRDARVELHVERLWGQPLYRLRWRNRMGGATGDSFEGLAVYEERGQASYSARWWDSGGGRHPIEATANTEGTALTALWGASGRTVYTLLRSGELEVVDSVKREDGTWGEFGRSRLKRGAAQ